MKTLTLVLGSFLSVLIGDRGAAQARSGAMTAPHVAASRANPTVFVPNLGQWTHRARFVANTGAATAFFGDGGWTMVGRRGGAERASAPDGVPDAVALRMSFGDGSGTGPVGEQLLDTRHHYFLGDDPSGWRSQVPCFHTLRYANVLPGIDVRLREEAGHFAFDVLVAAEAAAASFVMRIEGMERMHVDAAGDLVLATALGDVRMTAPIAWEEDAAANRWPLASRFVLHAEDRVGFEVGTRTPGRRLVIDPGILWSSSLAGSNLDRAESCVLDATGAAYVGGYTWSANFPVTPGAFDLSYGTEDAFLTKLTPAGAIQFSTFLGGSVSLIPGPFGAAPTDEIHGVAVDGLGQITVTGRTFSADFPTTPGAFLTGSVAGGNNVFVTRFAPNGASLVYSTIVWLGVANAIAVDAQGEAIIVGTTNSQYWPTTPGALSATYSGTLNDGFVTRVGPTGAWLSYSTLLSGNGWDEPNAVAIDAQGRVTVAGATSSTNFPTTPGAFDPSYNVGLWVWDAFVLRFAANFAGLDYATYLGGSDNDMATGVAVDAQGEAVVVGWTLSTNFPTTPGAFDTTLGSIGAEDVFVTRLSANGASLVGSTYLGGSAGELAYDVALDARSDITVVGNTGGAGFPTTLGAFDTSYNGGYFDPFLTRLRRNATAVTYSTFLPGSGDDWAQAVALGQAAEAVVTCNAGGNVVVQSCDLLPTGASAFGISSPGCRGALAIGVDSMPRVGNAGLTITCGNAAPSAVGLLAFTATPLPNAIPVLGVDVWIDPSTLLLSAITTADARGAADFGLPVPNNPALATVPLQAQFLWLGPTAPSPCPLLGWASSNALALVIQP